MLDVNSICDLFRENMFLPPGITKHLNLTVSQLLSVHREDPNRFSEMIKQYLNHINKTPVGLFWDKDWTIDEMPYSHPSMIEELESFHSEQCRQCNYHEYEAPSITPQKNWTESKYRLYEMYLKTKRPRQTRKMSIIKGQYVWHYICERCQNK